MTDMAQKYWRQKSPIRPRNDRRGNKDDQPRNNVQGDAEYLPEDTRRKIFPEDLCTDEIGKIPYEIQTRMITQRKGAGTRLTKICGKSDEAAEGDTQMLFKCQETYKYVQSLTYKGTY